MTQFTAYIHRPFRRFFLHFITQVSRNAVYRYTYILTSGDVCNSSYLQSPQHILCVFWRGNLKLSGEKNGVLVPILFTNVINCFYFTCSIGTTVVWWIVLLVFWILFSESYRFQFLLCLWNFHASQKFLTVTIFRFSFTWCIKFRLKSERPAWCVVCFEISDFILMRCSV